MYKNKMDSIFLNNNTSLKILKSLYNQAPKKAYTHDAKLEAL
jgi:hypothetical protein